MGADCEGSEATAGERKQDIGDDNVLLEVVVCCISEAEGRPVDPEEESSDHGEGVGVCVCFSF